MIKSENNPKIIKENQYKNFIESGYFLKALGLFYDNPDS